MGNRKDRNLNSKSGRGPDPFEERIEQEVEEFLKDLTLEFPFQEIFETLKRHEFKGRFGSKVMPFPERRVRSESLKDLKGRIQGFLERLELDYGQKYGPYIQETFRRYSATTLEV